MKWGWGKCKGEVGRDCVFAHKGGCLREKCGWWRERMGGRIGLMGPMGPMGRRDGKKKKKKKKASGQYEGHRGIEMSS